MCIKEALIICGGEGTRLRSVIGDTPKILAPIRRKPFIEYLITNLSQLGIERFILALGKGKDQIKAYCKKRYKNRIFLFSEEEKPLGTGGALKKALSLSKEAFILVTNGDSLLLSPSLVSIIKTFIKSSYPLMLIGIEVKETTRFGRLEINKKGELISFKEKQLGQKGIINSGIYLLNRKKMSNYLKYSPEKFSFEKWLEREVQRGMLKIKVGIVKGFFIDIGVPKDYYQAQEELPKRLQV